MPYREQFLDELIRLDGRADFSGGALCSHCGKLDGDFRCSDCFGGRLSCCECFVNAHAFQPLHRVSVSLVFHSHTVISNCCTQRWNGSFFERMSLKECGLLIQLGHSGLHICPRPTPGPKNFTVVDTSGIHQVAVSFCNCPGSDGIKKHYVQLLRAGWFPATLDTPCTVFTFEVLDNFHQSTLQAKTNAYDFLKTIQNRTDGSGTVKKTVTLFRL